jgi:hypothetical protein
VPRLRSPRRSGRRRLIALKNLGAHLLQFALHRERQLLDVRDATQPRELRRQLKILGDEALVFAIEEETDLAERLDVVFVSELDHAGMRI